MPIRSSEHIRFYQAFYAIISMQRSNGADRAIVAGYSGGDPPIPHIEVSRMYILPVAMVIVGIVAWVAIPVVLLFRLTQ
jgi:hypothetical protein